MYPQQGFPPQQAPSTNYVPAPQKQQGMAQPVYSPFVTQQIPQPQQQGFVYTQQTQTSYAYPPQQPQYAPQPQYQQPPQQQPVVRETVSTTTIVINPSSNTTSTDDNVFYVVSECNGLVLDIAGASTNDRAQLIVYPYNGKNNQRFRFERNGLIRALHSNKVLDVEGGVQKGAGVIQWAEHGGSNQLWKLHSDGTIRLIADSNLCLDVDHAKKESGTRVIVYPYNGGSNQRWRLVTKM